MATPIRKDEILEKCLLACNEAVVTLTKENAALKKKLEKPKVVSAVKKKPTKKGKK